jgi:pimeloyl-ACP methyl ester carboxylesterase
MRRLLAVPLVAALMGAAAISTPASAATSAKPSITAAKAHTVKAGPGRVGYRSIGKGRPLVMIMGLSGTMDAWPPSLVDALAKGRRVITFDNEGIRRSTASKGTLSIRRMADTTASLIRALKLRRPDVLGWSMGGMIAQSLAARHPKLVRRLVLCATAPGDGKGTAPAAGALGQLTGSSVVQLFGLLFPPGHEADGNAYAADLVRYPNVAPQAPPATTSRQLGATATWLIGQDPSGKRPGALRQRTLVAGGELDRLLPFPNQQHLARAIPHARLVSYPDAAHGFVFQHAAEFVPEVARFLR